MSYFLSEIPAISRKWLEMRLFYAIEVPEKLKHSLTNRLISLKNLGRHVRPVSPDGIHLTLLFLGEQSKSDLDGILSLGRCAVSAARPCELKIGPVGFFPNVSFLTLMGELATLRVISSVLKDGCAEYLEKPDDRPFKAHVTLARHKEKIQPVEKDRIRELFGEFEGLTWTANELVLFESELTSRGAIYTAIERFPFRG